MTSRSFLALLAAWSVGACNVSDPLDPINGTYTEPIHSGEQAEVAMTVAQDRSGAQTVATGYRFTGSYPLPGNALPGDPSNWDIVYATVGSNHAIVRRGASLMGHSYSPDGFTWIPGGKISPADPHLAKRGDQVAVIWGDPAMMSGFVDKKLVAYTDLAVSNTAFDANAVNGELPFFLSSALGQAPANIIDSVCVATSEDGGQTYPSIICVHPTTTSAPGSMTEGTDQTSVGVDKNDKIYVVTDDFGANDSTGLGLRLYRLFQSPVGVSLEPVAVDPLMADSHHTPRIARDQDGELWLAAATSGLPSAVRLCHITGDVCAFVGTMTTNADPFPVIGDPSSPLNGLRTGLTISFAVNRFLGAGVLLPEHHDFYFAYHAPVGGTGRLRIAAGECSFSTFFPFACRDDVASWASPTEGEHFQPTVTVVDRTTSQNGALVDVEYAFYEGDTAAVGNDHVLVRRATLHGSAFSGPTSSTLETLPLAPAPQVCPARYGAFSLYWGDYFAFGFVPNLGGNVPGGHLAVYSSDERLGCVPQTNLLQGRELHLQSWFWAN